MFVENKVALITGGASGLGFRYAVELLKNGLRATTLADVDPVKGQEAVTKITKDFGEGKVQFVQTDVTDKDQLKNAFQKTVDKFGNLDIIINNAGIMVEAVWEKMIDINLKGTIYGCLLGMEEYLPEFKSGDEAVIVNISSIVGLQSASIVPFYAASKHAIIGLSRSLGTADQYATTKTRIVTICPGPSDTPLMQELVKKSLNDRYVRLTEQILHHIRISPNMVDVVAKCLIRVIEEGTNGSIWVAEDDEIYEIEIPDRTTIKKK